MSEYNTKVVLKQGWSKNIDPEVLSDWLVLLNGGIGDDESLFDYANGNFRFSEIEEENNTVLLFKKEEDATLFRLRFGL